MTSETFLNETLDQFLLRLPKDILRIQELRGSDLDDLKELCSQSPWREDAAQWQRALEWLFGTLEILKAAGVILSNDDLRLALLSASFKQLPSGRSNWRLGLARDFIADPVSSDVPLNQGNWQRSAMSALALSDIVQEFEESVAGKAYLRWIDQNFSCPRGRDLDESEIIRSIDSHAEAVLSGAVRLSMVLDRCYICLVNFRSNRPLMSALWAFFADTIFSLTVFRGHVALREISLGINCATADIAPEVSLDHVETGPMQHDSLFNTGLWRENRRQSDLHSLGLNIRSEVDDLVTQRPRFNATNSEKVSYWSSSPLYKGHWKSVRRAFRREILDRVAPALIKYNDLAYQFSLDISEGNRIRVHEPTFLPNSYIAEISLSAADDGNQRSVIAVVTADTVVHVDGTTQALDQIVDLGTDISNPTQSEEYIRFACSASPIKNSEIVFVDDPTPYIPKHLLALVHHQESPVRMDEGTWVWETVVLFNSDLFNAAVRLEAKAGNVRVNVQTVFARLTTMPMRRFEQGVWITPEPASVNAFALS